LVRVENGEVGLSVTDLRAMLRLYKITDRRAVADLSEAARGSRGSSWWSAFRDVVSPKFALYLGQEASAASIRVFHPFLVPGLLHTEDYALELLRVHCSEGEARRIVEMRRRRQQNLLGHPDSPDVIFVFGEEALHRRIGSPAIMKGQLEHLVRASGQDGISVEVIPFSAGAHAGLLGPFILLDFEDSDENLLFVEGLSGELISRGERERVDRFSEYFDAMRNQAVRGPEARSLLERLIEELCQSPANGSGETRQASAGCLSAVSNASRPDEARGDRWRSPGVRTSLIHSSGYSPGSSTTPGERSASLHSSAVYYSSLSSALL
jgi:hypothetical protein